MVNNFGIIVLGDPEVGKTHVFRATLNYRLKNKQPKWRYQEQGAATIGVDFGALVVDAVDAVSDVAEDNACCIWDTSCNSSFDTLRQTYIYYTHIQILVFDLTSTESFKNLAKYLEQINGFTVTQNIILIGNKSDLHDARKVSNDEIHAFMLAKDIFQYIEVSCKEQMENGLVAVVKAIRESHVYSSYKHMESVSNERTRQSRDRIEKPKYYFLLSGLKFIFNVILIILSAILVVATLPLMLAYPSFNPFVNNKQKRNSYFNFWGECKPRESLSASFIYEGLHV